jgi:hypothetical protein
LAGASWRRVRASIVASQSAAPTGRPVERDRRIAAIASASSSSAR